MAKKQNGLSVIEIMNADGRVKRALCPACGCVVLGARMPLAETEQDSIKAFREYARKGWKIDIVPLDDLGKWCATDCPRKKPKSPQDNLF